MSNQPPRPPSLRGDVRNTRNVATPPPPPWYRPAEGFEDDADAAGLMNPQPPAPAPTEDDLKPRKRPEPPAPVVEEEPAEAPEEPAEEPVAEEVQAPSEPEEEPAAAETEAPAPKKAAAKKSRAKLASVPAPDGPVDDDGDLSIPVD